MRVVGRDGAVHRLHGVWWECDDAVDGRLQKGHRQHLVVREERGVGARIPMAELDNPSKPSVFLELFYPVSRTVPLGAAK